MNGSVLLPAAAASGILCLCSCSTIKSTAEQAGEAAGELTSDFETPKLAGFFGGNAPVVEVREKDLKDMPLGEERALAYKRSRRSFWDFFSGPVDFEEPDLPDQGEMLNGSLLPPKED
jgi:hypothetical protein